jgi:hypothetical protein
VRHVIFLPANGRGARLLSLVAVLAAATVLPPHALAQDGRRGEPGLEAVVAAGAMRLDGAADAADVGGPGSAPLPEAIGQGRPRPKPVPRRPTAEPAFRLQAFGELGYVGFTASETFAAALDRSGGMLFGGGVRVSHRRGFFGQLGVSRFSGEGERAFVFNNEVFRLGIPLTVTVMPIEVTGGYRFVPRPRTGAPPPKPVPGRGGAVRRSPRARRLVPYVGGGLGRVLYSEASEFATAQQNVDESFTSYHLLGGVDVPLSRRLGIGAEVKYRWVPDALGTGGLSQAFGETDLGGPVYAARVTIGR